MFICRATPPRAEEGNRGQTRLHTLLVALSILYSYNAYFSRRKRGNERTLLSFGEIFFQQIAARANVDKARRASGGERGFHYQCLKRREDLKGKRKKDRKKTKQPEMFSRCGSKQAILLPSARHSSYIEKHRRPRNREGQEEKEKTRKMKENQSPRQA